MGSNVLKLDIIDPNRIVPKEAAIPLPAFAQCTRSQNMWINDLITEIWKDEKLDTLGKVRLLDEVALAWPFDVRQQFHNWRYQFKDKSKILDIFKNESPPIRAIIEDLVHLHEGNLDVLQKLWAIRSSISNQKGLLDWMLGEFQVIPWTALCYTVHRPKKIVIQLNWCAESSPLQVVPYELTVEPDWISPAIEPFLRLLTGDNHFGQGDRSVELVGCKLGGRPEHLEIKIEDMNYTSHTHVMERMLTDVEKYLEDRVVLHNAHTDGRNVLYIHFLQKEDEVEGVDVGGVSESTVPSSLVLCKGTLLIAKVNFILS